MSVSMSERGVRHIALKTRDLEATERFYVDVLGFERLFPEEEMLSLQTPSGGDALNFTGTEEPFDPSAGGFDHFGIHVPERDWSQLPAQLERGRCAHPRTPGARSRSTSRIPTAIRSSSTRTSEVPHQCVRARLRR